MTQIYKNQDQSGKDSEEILAIDRKILYPDGGHYGIKKEGIEEMVKVITENAKFYPRVDVEEDPSRQQIISYIIFNFGNRYFVMKRASKEQYDKRLKDSYALGIGGHIRKEDLNGSDIFEWVKREFEEEVEFSGNIKITPLGLLNDDTMPLEIVHTGLVLMVEGDSDQIKIKEEDKLKDGRLATLAELSKIYDQMENWAKIVFNFLSEEEKLRREEVSKIGREVPQAPVELPEPQLTSTGEYIAKNNYLQRDETGHVHETVKGMFWRVAHNIAAADLFYGNKKEMEKSRDEFYEMLSHLEFIPNTPTFANAAGKLQQLSACFVLPIEDDLSSIGKTLWQTMMIHKTGGGTGFSFSKLRPYGSIVRSTGRTSSGAVYFMWMYADATDRVQQGGYRRGANMGVMNVNHPDILRWITVKSTESTVNSFNLSVGITEEFMKAVEKDKKFAPEGLKPQEEELKKIISKIQEVLGSPNLIFGDKVMAFEKEIVELKNLVIAKEEGEGYELINPNTNEAEAKLNAFKIFELIARMAWEKGDPGIIFLDRINRDNPTPHIGQIEATNPCGEQPLLPYESCNLGAVNLARMISDTDGKKEIDWDKISETVKKGVHFLDNVIDMNQYPLPEIEAMTKANRKVGLGVMGWANLLAVLEIPYNSSEAFELASKLMTFIRDNARVASMEIAKRRGTFPNYKGSIFDPESKYYKGEDLPLRNATLTTVAPTGTTSMLADVNSGIEPFFALWYRKNIVNGDSIETLNPNLLEMAQKMGFWSDDLLEKIKNNKGSLKGLDEVPEEVQRIFPIAADLSPYDHIMVQAAFQKHGVDNAISKTINMPNSVTVEDVMEAYLTSYREGCKGVTIYRDNSRKKQILVTEKEKAAIEEDDALKPRPVKVEGATYKIATPLGNAFITINHDANGNPFELFVTIGKAGSEVAAMAEGLGRMISTTLRFGNHLSPIDRVKEIMEQLRGIGGSRAVGFGPNRVRSLPDAIAKALGMHFGLMEFAPTLPISESEKADDGVKPNGIAHLPQISLFAEHKDFCPGCGDASLIFEEGCKKCHTCGYSEC